MKKICFAVLVHEKRDVVEDLLHNITKFCPNSSVVLFNGGPDSNLLMNFNYPICPYSKPLKYLKSQVFFMLETMKWLSEINFEFDYLINLDSDVLFAKHGFEEFLLKEMSGKDFLGIDAQFAPYSWNFPSQTMKKEWHRWKPIYEMDDFYWCFNNAQVYSKKLVKQIICFDKLNELVDNLKESKAVAAEEIIYITLAKKFGHNIYSYPEDMNLSVRFRPYFTKQEVEDFLRVRSNSFLFHPIHRNINDEARVFIRSIN